VRNKNALYINPKGYPVTRHSFSASDTFNFCPRKYELEKVSGWREREQRASTRFGIALENAWRFWHEHNQDIEAAVLHFVEEWNQYRPVTKEEYAAMNEADRKAARANLDLVYSKADVDWWTLFQNGQEMLRLYALRYPTFPFEIRVEDHPFQVQMHKEMFPGDEELEGIETWAYIDCIAHMKDTKDGEAVILDCKTSGKPIPDYIVLDPQLQTYAWITTIYLNGFLWFQKTNRAIEKGSEVSFLAGSDAGKLGYVLGTYKDPLNINPNEYWVTKNPELQAEMDKLFPSAKKSVEALAAKQKWLEERTIHVPENFLTKQQVCARITKIPKKLADDQGESLGQDIVRIHEASQTGFFPQHGGVRFPNLKCPTCPMRGICAGDDKLRDTLLVREQSDDLGATLRENDND
jgi:PD-(D/E)XK nuclease superfamily